MAKGATAEISEKHTGKSGEPHLQGVHQEISHQLRSNGNIKQADNDLGHQVIKLFGNLVIDGLHNAETGAAKLTEQVTAGRISTKEALSAEKSTEHFVQNSADVASAAFKGAGNELAKEAKPVLNWAGKHPAEALLVGAAVTAGAFALPEMIAGTAIASTLTDVAIAARVATVGVTAFESTAGVVASAVKTGDFQTFMDSAIAKFPALETFFKPLDSAHKVQELGISADDRPQDIHDKTHR